MTFMSMHRGNGIAVADGPHAEPGPDAAWERLRTVALDRRRLARHRVITADRTDPAHVAFDVLRTRLLQTLKARGWRRLAITSPTQGCGKSFVAVNLAFSLARRASCRTVLMDMDLRIPSLAGLLGIRDPECLHTLLTGKRPVEAHLLRVRPNLAVGPNAAPVFDAAELLQEPAAAEALRALQRSLEPDVVLYDLPPMLTCDDVIAFLPHVDAVLLVVGGGITRAEDVRKCERLFAEQVPLLGVILNMADDPVLEPYYGMKG
jgi:Mrp family chromosome partitioning ATPase